jgi:hypothetical protein
MEKGKGKGSENTMFSEIMEKGKVRKTVGFPIKLIYKYNA